MLGKSRFLEVVTLAELCGCDFKHVVELLEEGVDALFLVLDAHAFDCEFHDVDCGERQVAASDRCLFAEAVFKHARAASHCSHFVVIAFRVVGAPFLVEVEGGVKVHEVGEEAACCHFACQFIQVVVAVFLQIVDAAFLFPNLDREDGCGSVAHSFVC